MKYIQIPGPIELKLRTGARVQNVDGTTMPALSFFDYAETWWNNEKLNAGGIKGRRQTEKIMAAFDAAKAEGSRYIALEDADYDRLRPVVEESTFFRVAPLEIQVTCFPEAVLEAKSQVPAALVIQKVEIAESSDIDANHVAAMLSDGA